MACDRPGCLMNVAASTWMLMFEILGRGKRPRIGGGGGDDGGDDTVRMMLVQEDISGCMDKLREREMSLMGKEDRLTSEARMKHASKDVAGAKRKLLERRRVREQADRVRNGMSLLEQHMSTIEGTEMDKSILEALKASGHALKRLGIEGGIDAVQNIVSETEIQIEQADEINRTLATGMFNSYVNSMGVADEDELEQELRELMGEDMEENIAMSLPAVPRTTPFLRTHGSVIESEVTLPPGSVEVQSILIPDNEFGNFVPEIAERKGVLATTTSS